MKLKQEMAEKIDALQHIQAAIDALDNLKTSDQETIASGRDLKNARKRMVEVINGGARL